MRLRHVTAIMLSAIVLLAACGSKDEEGSGNGDSKVDSAKSSTTTAAAADAGPTEGVTDTEITIGVHTPLKIGTLDVSEIVGTGPLTEAFWKYSNEHHKVNGRTVNVLLVDDGFDPAKAIQACRDVVAKGVFMISGTGGTDQIIVCAQLAASKGITYTSLGVADLLTKDPNYFALTITYDGQAKVGAKLMMTRLGGKDKKIAIVKENTPNLDEAVDTFVKEVERLGGKVAVRDTVGKPPSPEDLTNECLKLKAADAEIVYTWMPTFSLSSFAKQCTAQGYKPQFLGIANGGGCQVTGTFGAAELDGCLSLSTNRNPDEVNPPIEEECRAAWAEARPGKELPSGGEQLCGFFDVLRKALELAGKNPTQKSFRAALHGMDYDNGMLNPIKFGKGQVGSDQVVVIRAKGDKLVEEPSGWQTLAKIG